MLHGLIALKFWEESYIGPVLDSCWFVLTRVGLVLTRVRLVLIRAASCWTRVRLVLTRVGLVLTRVRLVLICVDSCWFVLNRVDLCWYSCIRIDLIFVLYWVSRIFYLISWFWLQWRDIVWFIVTENFIREIRELSVNFEWILFCIKMIWELKVYWLWTLEEWWKFWKSLYL